jgi:alcohol dehydrogenase/L-iditol 2-dehydrogenase
MDLVRPNGRITKIGWDAHSFGYSLDPLVAKAVTLQGSFSHTWASWERVIKLVSLKKIDTRSMFQSFPLNDWRSAFQKMDNLTLAKAVLLP